MSTSDAKTTTSHWNAVWSKEPRWRLPSRLNVGVWDMQRLLRRHVRPGMRVLEIGCAPGKLLAWVAKVLHATVSGIDYSEIGMAHARKLFKALDVSGDLRQENVFESTIPQSTFDVVYSLGVIEHFDDPRDIVRRHISFAAPGGIILIVVPNYGGIYGRLQRYFDPENLSIHNLGIMSAQRLQDLIPPATCRAVRSYRYGRLSPWLINFHHRWNRSISLLTALTLNAIGLVQPVPIPTLSPFIVLEATRLA